MGTKEKVAYALFGAAAVLGAIDVYLIGKHIYLKGRLSAFKECRAELQNLTDELVKSYPEPEEGAE